MSNDNISDIFKNNERKFEFLRLQGAMLGCHPATSTIAVTLMKGMYDDFLKREITENDFNGQYNAIKEEIDTFLKDCSCDFKKNISPLARYE